MKRTILILAGVAAVVMGAYFSSQLFAQQAGGTAAPQGGTGTRVAVVNIGHVFNKYVRAEAFKRDIEERMKPFKDKANKLTQEAKYWHEESLKVKDQATKEKFELGVRDNKRKLEDLQLEVQKLIGKTQEDNLMTLWKEVNTGIEAVAKANGYQIVLGYGDPMEKEMLSAFPNINRKMQAMDQGSTVPLYVHTSVDLSQYVADTLNSWVQGAQKK